MPIWAALILCLLSVTGGVFFGALLAAAKRHELEAELGGRAHEIHVLKRRIVKLIALLLQAKVTGTEQGDA